jgi:hypothetical protein
MSQMPPSSTVELTRAIVRDVSCGRPTRTPSKRPKSGPLHWCKGGSTKRGPAPPRRSKEPKVSGVNQGSEGGSVTRFFKGGTFSGFSRRDRKRACSLTNSTATSDSYIPWPSHHQPAGRRSVDDPRPLPQANHKNERFPGDAYPKHWVKIPYDYPSSPGPRTSGLSTRALCMQHQVPLAGLLYTAPRH